MISSNTISSRDYKKYGEYLDIIESNDHKRITPLFQGINSKITLDKIADLSCKRGYISILKILISHGLPVCDLYLYNG